MAAPADLDLPWTRSPVATRVREFLVCGVLGTAMDLYTRRELSGHQHLDRLEGPVIFVANHNSHMDTPALLRALPKRWRRRTSVAAAVDYFYVKRRSAISASLVFGTVPLDRSGGGLGSRSTAHLRRLFSEGRSLLMFAEGTRSHDGTVAALKSGAAVLAAEHDLPIVPIFVSGTGEAMPRGTKWMNFKNGRPFAARHQIEIRFGDPIRPRAGEHRADVMERVRLFLAESGATTEHGGAPAGPTPSRQPV